MRNHVQADIGVSVNYPTIIPNSIIRLFRHGILNTHGGDYRVIEETLVKHG